MIFNIYYINLPKVYEIKMMLDNKILLKQSTEEGKDMQGKGSFEAGLNLDFLKPFNIGKAGVEGEGQSSRSKKVLEDFEVKTTKSIILNEVIEKSKETTKISNANEGELILLNDVKLSLANENELRVIKLFNSGAFKNFMPKDTNGLDINNLFNSMFKDYAYKVKGKLKRSTEELLIKVPLSFKSEFENSYGVDDLFIGNVSIVGLYKGKIRIEDLRNSFEYFKEIGDLQNLNSAYSENEGIQDSYYKENDNDDFLMSESEDSKEYHYLDLLAVVQKVKISE